ncbi:MAG: DUF4157 domain-containing protein [Lacibacter sp.]
MFSSAEKTKNVNVQRQQQQPGNTFFRKAGEESFFGSTEASSFFSPAIQAKLSVSSPDDPQEKEADAVAEQVMRMPEPVASPQSKEEEKLQKKEDEQEMVQAKHELPLITIQRKCEACEKEEKAQAKLFHMIQRSEDVSSSFTDDASAETSSGYNINRKELSIYHSDVIQRSGRGPPAGHMQGTFEQNLSSSKGAGSPLPSTTKQFMESRFNADFSGVRIHTGSYAESLSNSIHAQAFTHGNDIYFNSGKYSPHTGAGGTLLAHELTHTIQQGASASHQSSTVSPKIIARKNSIQRSAGSVPSQLTNAVEKAKTVEGKIDANKPQADGNRTGWEHLLDIFKTTFGEEMIVSGSGTSVQGAVAEQDIKKKRETTGMIVDKTTVTTANAIPKTTTGARDAMPSWCGIFVFWSLNKSGVPMPKWKLGESMIKPEAVRAPGSTPLPGDIAYRNAYSHFAIVETANAGTVRTVNGNTAGEDNLGGQVQTIEHPMSAWTAFFDPLKLMQGSLGNGESAAANAEPKTLAELRKNVLHVDTKQEDGEQTEETTVQPKHELSNWNVDAKGSLQNQQTALQRNVDENELQKKEEDKKEEEKLNAGAVNQLQKKEAESFADTEASEYADSETESSTTSVQTKQENENSSLINNEHVPVMVNAVHERGPPVQCRSEESVQRSVIDDALAYTSLGALLDCVQITDPDATSICLLRKARDVALHIPGYRALRVVLGRDPITGENIERNGHNFLEAAFDIMPGGELLYQKLNEQHQLDAAAEWIDGQIANLETIVNDLFSDFDQFWNGLGIDDFTSPMQVLSDGANIVLRFINRIIDFAVNAAVELLEMVKEYLLQKIVDFIKEQTTAYPLLTVILGEDPVTKQQVDRNGTNILNALLELGGEEGVAQRTQMQETGTFQKVAGYIDEGIAVFGDLYDSIVQNFSRIWDMVTIDALMDPVETFRSIYNIFAEPINRVLDFVIRVGREILKLVKEVLMQRLSAWARTVRGYALVTVIIGKDPFTDEAVPFTMENVIKGFFSLMEGGEEQYNQLKESGAIDRTVAKITAAVNRLNMTPAAIVQLFIDLWNSFSINDLMDPIGCFRRILARFGEPIGRLIAFVIEIVKIVIEAILIVMNFPFDLINNIITRAMAAFDRIKRDPVAFLKNLLRAIKQGFIQFFDNILQHLITGLTGWLMSELRDAGVPELTDFSLRGIIAWVLQVLGISMEKIWEKLAAHPRIGPQRVARIRSMINTLEGIWTFIKDVQERGMAAIWDKIQEQLSNLWNTILDAVKNWVMEQIINRITARLLSMLDPTGIMAVVNSAIAIYSAIQSFIKYLREMLEVVNSFVNGVADIAEGNVTTAANYLERTMARAMPIVIGFLANQVGLSGIGRRVGEMIERAREMVDQALTWLVNRAVDTGMNLIDRLMGRGGDTADPLVAVRQDLHREESSRLTNGAISHEDANTVAQSVAVRNNTTVSSIQVVDGGEHWNYNIIQRTAETGPVKKETGCSEPGTSAAGIGNISRHGSQGSSLRNGPQIHWIESEHVLPFATGRTLWEALSLILPTRGSMVDRAQTTIMIYYGAARIKTPPDNTMSATLSQLVEESGLAGAFQTTSAMQEDVNRGSHTGGTQMLESQVSELLHTLLANVESAKENAVTRTNDAVQREHVTVADGCTKTNGERRGEATPKPTPNQVEQAASQQYTDVVNLVTQELHRLIDRRLRR